MHEQAERRGNQSTTLGDRVRSCLRQYLSRINTEVVLSRTCTRCGVGVHQLGPQHIDRFLSTLRPALTLYLNGTQVETAIRALRDISDRKAPSPAASRDETSGVDIRGEGDIESARTCTLRIARMNGLRNVDAVKCATVVSELARNIFQHAGTGRVSITRVDGPRPGLRIEARDQGPGIPNPTRVLSGRFRSGTGLGLGLQGSQRLMDEFEVESAEDTGTRVSAIKYL